MGLGGLGGRGGWQARQFVCRRHKLVRPRDIQTRPDASRAPLICLASEQVHSSSSSSWFSWNSKSSSAGSSCPFSLCAGAGNFLISYDYSRICHLFTQTHGWGKGGWRGLCVYVWAYKIMATFAAIPQATPTPAPVHVLIAVNLKTNVCQFIFHFGRELSSGAHQPISPPPTSSSN